MEFLVHPVNKGLVPIHYKYFVRNLTLHHFLLSPVACEHSRFNKPCKLHIEYACRYSNISEHTRIFFCISCITMCMPQFGNCLPLTELLQSPFRMEFSMGSLSRQYRRSLQCHRLFLRSYRRSLRRSAVADADHCATH